MKHPTFILLLFLAGITTVSAQTYLSDSNQWTNLYAESDFSTSQPHINYTYKYYYINGESVVNNYHYKKIYVATRYCGNAQWGPPISPCNSAPYTVSFVGLLRESGPRWYFRSGNTESLLYRFDMVKGDTLWNSLATNNYPNNYVVIDTVIQNYQNTGRKFFQVNSIMGDNGIIEGVGPNVGFMSFLFEPFEIQENLICYNSQTMGLLYGSCASWPKLLMGLKEQNDPSQHTVIYPNPATSFIQIKLNSFDHNDLKIFDSMGRLVLQQEFASDEQISVSQLDRGIYFAEISEGSHRSHSIFMKE